MNGTLAIFPVEIREARTTRIVIVACPYCDRTHQHGWPYECTEIGSRVADCGGGSYWVQAVQAEGV